MLVINILHIFYRFSTGSISQMYILNIYTLKRERETNSVSLSLVSAYESKYSETMSEIKCWITWAWEQAEAKNLDALVKRSEW